MTFTSDATLDSWRINDRVTTYLVQNTPSAIWASGLPSSPRRTVRGVAAHLHNTRCSWIRGLAAGTVDIPEPVDPYAVTRRELVVALRASGKAMLRMLEESQSAGGRLPGAKSAFVWGAWPRDVHLFTAYAISHEAHHRGQLLVMARELGHRFPAKVVAGLWQWSTHLRQPRPRRKAAD